MPLSPALENRIRPLTVPQFRALLAALGYDTGGLPDRPSEDERIDYFGRCMEIYPIADAQIDAQVVTILAKPASDETILQLLGQKIVEVVAAIQKSAPSQESQPHARQVIQQLKSIRAAKGIHDVVQHQLGFKLAEFARIAGIISEKPAARPAASRIVRYVVDDVKRAVQNAPALRATYRQTVESESAKLLDELTRLGLAFETASTPGVALDADMSTVLNLDLRPYVAQIPSLMHQALVQEGADIPWTLLGTVLSSNGAAPQERQAFTSLKLLFDELVRDHGRWQGMNNEITLLSDRIDPFFQRVTTAMHEVNSLARKIGRLAESAPLAEECVPLAGNLQRALKPEPLGAAPDEPSVRKALEELEAFVSRHFNNADNQLLNACSSLDSIAESLRKFS